MEAGDRETIRRFWLRGLAQKVDCRKDVRLDQSQSPPGSRLRALRYDCRRLRPPRHDPHYAQATCCKRLVMNPNFPDGLLDMVSFDMLSFFIPVSFDMLSLLISSADAGTAKAKANAMAATGKNRRERTIIL